MTTQAQLRLAWSGPRSYEEVRAIFEQHGDGRLFYGANTCWWSVNPADLRQREGLPCDPRGGMLLETEDLDGWLAAATANPAHYGPYGSTALLAAYHGNVLARRHGAGAVPAPSGNGLDALLAYHQDGAWLPTCLQRWVEYTELLDGWKVELGTQIERAENSLSSAPPASPLVVRLAHARSEWALGNLLVCDRDLGELRFLGIEGP